MTSLVVLAESTTDQSPTDLTNRREVQPPKVIEYDHDELMARSHNTTYSQASAFARHVEDATGIEFSVHRGPWLAGGAVRRSILGVSEESDFDLFFSSEGQIDTFVDKLQDGSEEYSAVTISKNKDAHTINFTYSGEANHTYKIQLITRRTYQSITELFDSFDFTICQFAYAEHLIFVGEYALWDLGRKRLAVHRISFPISSIRRLIKYANQGFYVCNGAITAILQDVVTDPSLIDSRWLYVD